MLKKNEMDSQKIHPRDVAHAFAIAARIRVLNAQIRDRNDAGLHLRQIAFFISQPTVGVQDERLARDAARKKCADKERERDETGFARDPPLMGDSM